MNQKQPTKNFIRGGQVIAHNLRMLMQTGKLLLLVGVSLLLVMASLTFFVATHAQERVFLSTFLMAKQGMIFKENKKIDWTLSSGQTIQITSEAFLQAPATHAQWQTLKTRFERLFPLVSIAYLALMILLIALVKRYGHRQSQAKHLRGDQLVPVGELKKALKARNETPGLCLSREALVLPKSIEPRHFLVCGSTGTGKSNLLKSCLQQLRNRGDKVIVYDKNANFLPHFFEPNQDTLLNPLDRRCRIWDLWQECQTQTQFDSLAAALIPQPRGYSDPFWIDAARTLFTACAQKMQAQSHHRLEYFLNILLNMPLSELANTLKETPAAALINADNEKTSLSIRTTLTPYLKSLQLLTTGANPFSLRSFIKSDDPGWLFLTSSGDNHESLRPLLSLWLDIVAQAILSLPTSYSRRIWLILDELPSLQVLPSLKPLLSEGRNFGACVLAGIQNYAQLSDLYGQDAAKSLSSLFNTRLLFHQPDPNMAQWSAQNLGETITDEAHEGFSYGASRYRDGVSVSRIEQHKPLIYPTDILNLEPLQAYLRLPGNLPITKLDFDYVNYEQRQRPLVAAPLPAPKTAIAPCVKTSQAKTRPAKQSTAKSQVDFARDY